MATGGPTMRMAGNTTGVAPYKMYVESSLAEAAYVQQIGFEVKTGVWIGKDVRFSDLERDYDAIFLGVGLGEDSHMSVPGEDKPGVRGAIQVLQKIFKFRTCSLDIDEDDPRWRWFRPCLLHSIDQCTAPCNLRIDKDVRQPFRKSLNLDQEPEAVFAEAERLLSEAGPAYQPVE